MAAVTERRLRELLEPFTLVEGQHHVLPETVLSALSAYLDLLVYWNSRTNLTAVRDPENMVQRHFGESLHAALWLQKLRPEGASLLDFGSGAGLPGIPIQIWLPTWSVTLAESQGKKAAFLREAVRSLGLRCEVWASRVEALPERRTFDVVTMRAVDRMAAMREVALARIASGGLLLEMVGAAEGSRESDIQIPTRRDSVLRFSAPPAATVAE